MDVQYFSGEQRRKLPFKFLLMSGINLQKRMGFLETIRKRKKPSNFLETLNIDEGEKRKNI